MQVDGNGIAGLHVEDADTDNQDIDIDMDVRTIQQTLFSKLRITKKKLNNSKLSEYESPTKKIKKQSIAECRIEKDLKEINESEWKSFACSTTYKLYPFPPFAISQTNPKTKQNQCE